VLAKVDRILAPLMWIAAGLTVILLFAGPALIGADKETTGATAAKADGAAATADGKAVFAKSGCGGCHTLKAAGATGAVGPNLDDAKPSPGAVESIV
jgi:mono/diheme cytochrome c family protein